MPMCLELPWDSSVKMETKSTSHQSAAAAGMGEGFESICWLIQQPHILSKHLGLYSQDRFNPWSLDMGDLKGC